MRIRRMFAGYRVARSNVESNGIGNGIVSTKSKFEIVIEKSDVGRRASRIGLDRITVSLSEDASTGFFTWTRGDMGAQVIKS